MLTAVVDDLATQMGLKSIQSLARLVTYDIYPRRTPFWPRASRAKRKLLTARFIANEQLRLAFARMGYNADAVASQGFLAAAAMLKALSKKAKDQ